MEKATIIGVDLAKHVFQVHGACADGSVAFRKKISRVKLLPFLSSQPRCLVAMEACAGAHGWACQRRRFGGYDWPDKAIAATRHGLDPAVPAGGRAECAAQGGDLNGKVAFLDCLAPATRLRSAL